MDGPINRQWRLAGRPTGLAQPSDFEWREEPPPHPAPGEALVKTELLSLDPTNRPWMWERETYLPPVELGEVMRGVGIGRVIESSNPDLPAGIPVLGFFGWQDYAIVRPGDLIAPLPDDPNLPLTIHLGLFGHIGVTAYFGILDVARPQAGETVVVSAAAGAVGSLAGQIAKILGCRVVGVAGSDDKCRWITEELGFDGAINYRREAALKDALARECPDGIDVYFENVGGEILESVLDLMNVRGRIAVCGLISDYNIDGTTGYGAPGPRNLAQLVMKRIRMEGFLILDYWERAPDAIAALAKWYQEGQIKYRVHVVEGLEQAPGSLNMLFDGTNQGKLIVQV